MISQMQGTAIGATERFSGSASGGEISQRGQANSLVAAENADRSALYREIARANDHPEWEADVRKTFAQRWIDRAQAGWWVQRGGAWVKK